MRTRQMENGNCKRRIRRSTDLTKCDGFDWEPHAYIYTCKGYKIRLRFNQATGQWTCKCHSLKAETTITHQSPENIQRLLQDWIDDLLRGPWLLRGLPQTTGPAVPGIGEEIGVWINV